MGLEKYVPFGRNAMFGIGLGALVALSGCSALIEAPKRVTEEVWNTFYILASLPLAPFLRNEEPPLNGCIETSEEKVCRSYLSEVNPEGVTLEYFTVLKMNKKIPQTELVLGYFDGINYDPFNEDIKFLVVVAYSGESTEDLIEPYYGHMNLEYDKFISFFDKPRANNLDDSDNQFKNAMERGLIDDIKFDILRVKLKEIMQRGLELADEKLPKSN